MSYFKRVKTTVKTAIRNIVRGRKVISSIEIPVICDQLLSGKRAIVIGGTGGIGEAIVDRFLACGAEVVAAGTNPEKLRCLESRLGVNRPLRTIQLDLLNFVEYSNYLSKMESLFDDNKPFDILVNAAGKMSTLSFINENEREWDTVFDLNVKAPYFFSQVFARYLIKKGRKGHILNIGSTSSLKPGWTAYGISKAAVKSMTLGIADDLAQYGITVNCLAPGPVATEMLTDEAGNLANQRYKGKRFISPTEIANWAVYLTSSIGDMMLGDAVFVSAGSGSLDICKTHHFE